ncbi:hypothetical protein [Micromonospora sp. KLBMP9576]|uniref:hypothetical protein n=1 Tax=Micromonospora sp. KLBMP9576 TaxID=3424769 RepID=UPI003D917C69
MSEIITVEVHWLAVQPVPGLRSSDPALRRYFSVQPHVALLRQYDLPEKLWIVPHAIRPRDGFHQLASREILPNEVARTPYPEIDLVEGISGSVTSVSADLFPGDVLITHIAARAASPFRADLRSFLRKIAALRTAKSVSAVDGLVRKVRNLASGDRKHSADHGRYDPYFVMAIRLPQRPEDFDQTIDSLRPDLTALLIGAKDSSFLTNDLVDRVSSANEALNTKASSELLLLNRQGALYVTPAGEYRGPHLNRLRRTKDLATLACYARALLRDGHDFATTQPELAEFLVKKLEQWIDYPELTFDASVSHTLTWQSLMEHMLLEDRLAAWRKFFEGNQMRSSSGMNSRSDAWWSAEALDVALRRIAGAEKS